MCDHSLQGFGPIKKYKNFQIEGIYRSWFDIFYKIELELFLYVVRKIEGPCRHPKSC